MDGSKHLNHRGSLSLRRTSDSARRRTCNAQLCWASRSGGSPSAFSAWSFCAGARKAPTHAWRILRSDLGPCDSIGVIVAAIIMWTTGWYYGDPLISAAIGPFTVPRTWRLLREAVGVLLEGTPSDVKPVPAHAAASTVPGVAGLHDLHVWTVASRMNAMGMHAVLRRALRTMWYWMRSTSASRHDFNIGHATILVESSGCPASDLPVTPTPRAERT